MRNDRAITAAVLLAFAVTAAGCGIDLESISQVTKFRVLGVQTEPPETVPGGTVALRVLTADPAGEGRRVVAGAMVIPGRIPPSTADAIEEAPPLFWVLPFVDAYPNGIIDLGELGIPTSYYDEAAQSERPLLEAGEKDTLELTAIVLMCAGDGFDDAAMTAAIGDLFGGEGTLGLEMEDPTVLVDLCEQAGADEGLVATKTLTVSLDEENPNANPSIEVLLMKEGASTENLLLLGNKAWVGVLPWVDGGQPGEFHCEDDECREGVRLRAYLTGDSFQTYEKTVFDEIETVDERLYVSWFIDGGEFDVDRSGNDGTAGDPFEAIWLPPRGGGRHDLWLVAHDIRGGVSWSRFAIEALPPE